MQLENKVVLITGASRGLGKAIACKFALNGANIIAKPLKVDDYMEIGYITPSSIPPSLITQKYIDLLKALL